MKTIEERLCTLEEAVELLKKELSRCHKTRPPADSVNPYDQSIRKRRGRNNKPLQYK